MGERHHGKTRNRGEFKRNIFVVVQKHIANVPYLVLRGHQKLPVERHARHFTLRKETHVFLRVAKERVLLKELDGWRVSH